jgi:hypothetical protein
MSQAVLRRHARQGTKDGGADSLTGEIEGSGADKNLLRAPLHAKLPTPRVFRPLLRQHTESSIDFSLGKL